MTPSRDISRLLDIMAPLRTPGSGCPWDLEQNFATIAPYTIEEAYEVADAIARGDLDDLRDELGDLLLQVVFHARMAEEQNAFSFGDVVEAITRKMIRRHPHVFADKDGRLTPSDVKGAWDRIKAEEKAERAARRPPEETAHKSLLSGVKAGQPALTRGRWNCSARRPASASTGTIRARCCTRSARRPTRSRPRSIAATPVNSRKKPAICCSRWSTSRATSAPILRWRCAAPMPNSSAGLAISSARWRHRARSLEGASLAEMDALWNEAKGEE